MRIIKLPGERVSLAPVVKEDAELWCRWLNDVEVALPLGDEACSTITPDGMAAQVDEIVKRNDPMFTIVLNETGQAIGRCLLFRHDPINRSTMVGIFIGDKTCWNKGYGTEALELLLDYCFNLLNLHSVALGVFSFNERAIACYKKVGFRETGRRREARIIGGKAHDAVFMDILDREFTKSRITGSLK